MFTIIIAMIAVVTVPLDIIIVAHLVTAAVSSELKTQRDESPDRFRTVMWFAVWIAVVVIVGVAVAIVSTL